MSEQESKRRLMSKWEKIILIIVVLILGSVILKKMGIDIVKKTDKSEIQENPHEGYEPIEVE